MATATPARTATGAIPIKSAPIEADKAEALIKSIGLPAQPTVVLNIFKEMREKVPSFQKIAKMASQDPALVARVLKIINSPYYGKSVEIKSVAHALAMLGLENFRKFIMVAALRESLAGGKADELFQKIWFHSVTVARVAEYLSIYLKSPVLSDQAYMMGLFHDSAMNLLANKVSSYREIMVDASVNYSNLLEREEAVVGSNHAAIGALIARSFGISNDILLSIRHHHVADMSELPAMNEPDHWFILKMADYLAEYICFKADVPTMEFYSFGGSEQGIGVQVLQAFNLSMNDFQNIKEDVVDMIVLDGNAEF